MGDKQFMGNLDYVPLFFIWKHRPNFNVLL